MRITKSIFTALLTVLCLVFSGMALAADEAPGKPVNPAIEQKVLGLMEKMGNYLASTQTMAFTVDGIVQKPMGGQLLNFLYSSKVTLKRPNYLKIITQSDSKPTEFYYDGRNMTILSPKDKSYASSPAPAIIEELIPFAEEKAGLHALYSDLFTDAPHVYLTKNLTSAFIVGKSTINSISCDHLALKEEGLEWEIWIATGEKPLPLMMIVTYTNIPDKPTFIFHFSNWKLNAPIDKKAFAFHKPTGFVKIEFQQKKPMVTNDRGEKK